MTNWNLSGQQEYEFELRGCDWVELGGTRILQCSEKKIVYLEFENSLKSFGENLSVKC